MENAAWNSDWFLLLVVAIALGMLVTKRFVENQRARERAARESVEADHVLGLAFQQQGLLDMAFDKLRRVPLDGAVMEHLYALALDFERREEFDKAQAVFRHIAAHDPQFRDLPQRLAVPGTGVPDLAAGNAMLGRYEVERELGRGAMGRVYRGRDPVIAREVAIKTMVLPRALEPAEREHAKQRFLREARAAGRLVHPGIVAIHDAGVEHDLCYIVMELVEGRDLVAHTKQPGLLPPAKVLSIVERVAEAVDYAHAAGVVHRDIKPANILYAPETDTVKVTDFGVARIPSSAGPRTASAVGTPSYMSPEQLAGRRIDGRADLFALGVTLYQLLSGRLPFEAESISQLTAAIASGSHVPLRRHNPALPAGVEAIVERALEKEAERRFQSGAELAEAIRQVRSNSGAAADAPA
ncbi:MAG TPA: serine/threonine-protein kinase [Usitatibacter sp.]|nr:serine/threonine-protein kinase [Usitatibacter sp.]